MKHKRLNRGFPFFFLTLLSLLSTVVVVDVFWTTRLLRPIADDYASASSVIRDGLVGYVSGNYQNFSGEVVRAISDAVLVGVPLTYLPWSLGSALTFIVASLLAAGAVTTLVMSNRSPRNGSLAPLLLSAPILLLAWWSFWWAPVTASNAPARRALAESVTHWQIINSSYVILPVLFMIIWILITQGQKPARLRTAALTLWGVALGLTGPVIGVSVLIAMMVIAVARRARGVSVAYPTYGSLLGSALGILIGLAISQLSPGTRARSGIFESRESAVPLSFGNLLNWTVPPGLIEWWGLAFSVGSLVLIAITMGVGLLISVNGGKLNLKRLFAISAALLAFSVLYALVNRLSEAFAYPAFWHQVGFGTVLAVSIAGLGISLGCYLGQRQIFFARTAVGISLCIALLWAFSAERLMLGSIKDRYEIWISGPAPLVGGMPDIENPNSWVPQAWRTLADYRGDAPNR